MFRSRARRRSRLGRAVVATSLLLVGLNPVPVITASAAAPAGRVLPSNVLPGLAGLASVAPDPGATIQVGLALSRPDPSGEMALYQRLYQAGSSDYRHFLTPAQFNQRFGVSPQVYQQALSWLQDAGLSIDSSVLSHDFLLATGTVAQVERTFATSIRRYQLGSTTFLANTTAPTVPGDLPVMSVLGLNTFQRFSAPAHPTPPRLASAAAPVTTALGGLLPGVAGLPNLFATTPQSLWSIYQQPDAYRGAGQTMAVFGSGATAGTISDLARFEQENHLPAVPVTVRTVGPGPFTDTSGAVEWDIDTQASAGMAPDAGGLTLYFGSNLVDATVESLFTTWANDPAGPAQANASFGECERTPLDPILLQLPGNISQDPTGTVGIALGNNLEPVAEQTLRQATMEGRTLFSSSGDTGSSCPVVVLPVIGAGNGVLNQVVPLTSYPASSPYVVAVGGTVLYTSGTTPDTRVAEYAWTFGGGGDSLLISAPAYQVGTPGLFLPCVATADGQLTNAGQPCRGVPDVAAQSGDVLTNGYGIVAAGKDSQGGGTSLSSPLWMGMWARVNQSAGGTGYGFANETIYRLGKNAATAARDFYDITVGVNGLYAALPGWDYVTGFGTPRLTNFIADAH
ncbi:MAG: kumamolisin [Acidimicrobiaceae bacterium]|nr:kumamolisin [Acidimicrobiaceae bacterium]